MRDSADLDAPLRHGQIHLHAAPQIGPVLGIQPIDQREHLGQAHPLEFVPIGRIGNLGRIAVGLKDDLPVLLDTHDVHVPAGQHAASVMPGAGNENVNAELLLAIGTFDAAIPIVYERFGALEDLGGDVLQQQQFRLGIGRFGTEGRRDQISLGPAAVRHDHGRPILISAGVYLQRQPLNGLAQLGRGRGRRKRAGNRLRASQGRINLVGQHVFQEIQGYPSFWRGCSVGTFGRCGRWFPTIQPTSTRDLGVPPARACPLGMLAEHVFRNYWLTCR